MGLSLRAAIATFGVVALLPVAACGPGNESGSGSSGANQDVEVFTWWGDGGEKAGLDALTTVFGTACPGQKFVNGAVAGGAGANAKPVLASRLAQSNPPDTFQAHAGAELSDYITNGQVEDLSAQYREWGLTDAFPKGLINNLTVQGKIYSVPANIHRANVVWTNKTVLANAGITAVPDTLAEFFVDLDRVKATGIAAPLALGKDWTQLMLLESVLISVLGPSRFTRLWTNDTDWASADVTTAIQDFAKLLTYTNVDRDTLDWTDAEKMVTDGKAGYQLMGDWEAADLDAKGFKDYGYFAFPGNGDAYQWLADSFVLPKNAKNAEGAKCWLKTVGSAEGQEAFNKEKGSIPARTDASPAEFPKYQQAAMADWKKGRPVPSCAHGAGCSQGLQGAFGSAMGRFSIDGDVAGLQTALVAGAKQFITA